MMNKLISILILALFLIPYVFADDWLNDTFLVRQRFVLNSTVSTTLINFTTNLTINHAALVSQGCHADGSDIIILNDSNYIHSFEIDHGNNTNTMLLWILIPSFSNTYNLSVYCDNTTPVYVGPNSTTSWSSFTDVYHFQNNKNSATGRWNLNTTGSPTFQTSSCQFGTCLNTTYGSATGTTASGQMYYNPTNLFIECWGYLTEYKTYSSVVSNIKTDASDFAWGMMGYAGGVDDVKRMEMYPSIATSLPLIDLNYITHWVGIYNASDSTTSIFKDGVLVYHNTGAALVRPATVFNIGGYNVSGSNYWSGTLDECRLSTTIADKTLDWIVASQSSYSTGYTIETYNTTHLCSGVICTLPPANCSGYNYCTYSNIFCDENNGLCIVTSSCALTENRCGNYKLLPATKSIQDLGTFFGSAFGIFLMILIPLLLLVGIPAIMLSIVYIIYKFITEGGFENLSGFTLNRKGTSFMGTTKSKGYETKSQGGFFKDTNTKGYDFKGNRPSGQFAKTPDKKWK